MTDDAAPYRITCTPNPCNVGDTVTISYDFVGPPAATSPVTITIYWRPGDEQYTRFELSATDSSRDLIIPDCEGGLAVDASQQSGDCAITVNP